MTQERVSLPAEPAFKRPRGRPPKLPGVPDASDVVVLLAGLDTVCFSSRARVSEAVYAKLREAKAAARLAEHEGAAHCPDWLGAQVRPTGGRRGDPYLLHADDFTLNVGGEH